MNLRIFILLLACMGLSSLTMAQEDQKPFVMTLSDALQRADAVNLQVMMANARLEQAIARISEAQSDLLPHLEGDVSGGRHTSDLRSEGLKIPIPGLEEHEGPYNTFDARPRVIIALFDPSAFERFQAAKKGANLSAAELEKTREDILALVTSLFIDAQRKQQTVKFLKTLLERDQMSYELSEDNFTQGTGTELDANKFKTDMDQTKYLYSQAILQAQDSLLDLEAALQMNLNRPVLFLDDKDLMRSLELKAGTNFDHASNADMVMAASELEARRADQKTAYADFLPKISGSADYGRSGESPSNGSNTYNVGLSVSVPIWEGGEQQSKLKEVKGQVKEAQENLQDASQQEQVNIAKAHVAIAEAYDLRRSKIQQRLTAQKALRIAFHAQTIGSGSALEVMKAKADLATAEDEYNEAQATWVLAHIDLLHAQGRLRELVKKED